MKVIIAKFLYPIQYLMTLTPHYSTIVLKICLGITVLDLDEHKSELLTIFKNLNGLRGTSMAWVPPSTSIFIFDFCASTFSMVILRPDHHENGIYYHVLDHLIILSNN